MTNRVDKKGYYILEKHVMVKFQIEEIRDLELADFNQENVISELTLREEKDGYRIELGPCCGLAGFISTRRLSIEIEPSSGV
jgi:hypothetical protein